MDNSLLRTTLPCMRLGTGLGGRQFFATKENIEYILNHDELFQNNWLRGLLACIDHVKNDTTVERMVEIGSYQGESTSLFAMQFNPKDLYAIDPFVNGYDANDDSSFANFDDVSYNFKLRTEPFECVRHIKKFSYDTVDMFADNSLDFVYIDGDHTYEGVIRDINTYLPKIKLGGYMGGHDLGKGGVTKAIIEAFGDVDIHFDDSSWLVKVTPRIKRNAGLYVLPNTRLGVSISKSFTACDDDIAWLLENDQTDQTKAILSFFDHLKGQKLDTVVEINCYQGETTELFAKYLAPTSLYAVEKFDKQPKISQSALDMQKVESNFKFRIKPYPCVKPLKFSPETVLTDLFADDSIDLVYINEHSNKDYLKSLIARALPKLKKNGIIAGIGWGNGEVVNACLETIGEPDVFFSDSTWITHSARIRSTKLTEPTESNNTDYYTEHMATIPLITSVKKFRLGVPATDQGVSNQFYVSPQSIDFILGTPYFVPAPLQGALDLCDYVSSKTPVKNILELNSFQGELTTIFAHKFNPTSLHAVESFESRISGDVVNDDETIFKHKWDDVKHNFFLRSKQYPCIRHYDTDIVGAAKQFADGSLDFIYIGTNNSASMIKQLLDLYLPKLRDGGVIGGGEWGSDSVVKTITDTVSNIDAHFEDGSWVKRINKKRMQSNKNKLRMIQNSRIGIGVQEQFFATDSDIKFLSMLDNPAKIYLTGFIDFCNYVNKNQTERNFKIKRIVEINCYQGEATSLLAKYLQPEELWVVDQFDKIDDSWPKSIALDDVRHNFNLRTASYPCVKVIEDVDAMEAADRFEPGSIDLIYLNEYKSYQYNWRLLAQWLPKIRPEGFITGNYWGSGNVVQAALDHFGEPDIYFKDSSWSKIKIWDED